ncbi:MAG: hypothetical protein LKE46_10185 [Clostridium sp.]|jgi:hypothetical protein|uniref:Uncharacterized protein n=2 Tax=Clostridium TaxID=1485 RepID=A0A166T6W4_9CLOT|nr:MULTISPECIES: ABC-three component system middle component 7 [Clostridium]MCH3964631.1 hypothetical protein [Clostridium sp.]MCH4198592.1 hypothetical protein [Clostridium tyrobutyricum]MCH4258873.1 hypothetical protein [Clostridium tyrobutyricum]MCI1239779.1 hypothetical protein [Clostridium tyrobutyricum]MCI1651439.1 hypothetical protein [Clostridium tyrobutyricum]
MILPNKLISFQDCILAKTVYILEKICDTNYSVSELYEVVKKYFKDLNEYMLALDVLYVLEKVEYNEELQVIQYVKKNNL